MLFVSLMALTPYFWALSKSLKYRIDVFTPIPQWIPPSINTVNYREVFEMAPFGRYLVNTIIVVVGILFVQQMLIVLSAYVFARMKFRGSDVLFALYLVQMMRPIHAIIVPNYLTMSRLGRLIPD